MTIHFPPIASGARTAASAPVSPGEGVPGVRYAHDQVEITPDAVAPTPPAEKADRPALSVGLKLGTGLALGLAMMGVLTGCGGPAGPTNPPTPPGQTQQQPATLAERVSQLLKENKQEEARQLVQSSYYHQALLRLAAAQGEGTQAIVEWAQKGLAEYKPDADPKAVNQAMQAALQQIGQLTVGGSEAQRHQAVALGALAVGQQIGQAPTLSAGLLGELKAQGYQAALEQVLTLPQRVDENATGLPRDVVKAYVASLTDLAQIGLDAGKEVGDSGARSVVYQTSLQTISDKLKADGNVLGGQVQQLLDLIQKLNSQYGRRG